MSDEVKHNAYEFMSAFEAAIAIAAPQSIDEPTELVASRIHGVLVAAAWCTMTMLRSRLSDELWHAIADAAMASAREREAMRADAQRASLQ